MTVTVVVVTVVVRTVVDVVVVISASTGIFMHSKIINKTQKKTYAKLNTI